MSTVRVGDVFVHKDTGDWYAAIEGPTQTGVGVTVVIFRPMGSPNEQKERET